MSDTLLITVESTVARPGVLMEPGRTYRVGEDLLEVVENLIIEGYAYEGFPERYHGREERVKVYSPYVRHDDD